MMRALALAAVPLLLAACGEQSEMPSEPEATTQPSTNPLIERHDDARLIVDANGLSAKGGKPLRFGAARVEVDDAAEGALGLQSAETRNEECGAGPMDFTTVGPLEIAYQDGKFVGWYLTDGKGVVTSDGIRAGMPFAALESERPVRIITDSTLEGEFEYQTADGGMITGFFEGDQNDGKVSSLQAGLNCFFR